ncbi:MAG: hypothetical protein AAF433_11345 [Bacteroidota bacterium]
MSIQKSILALLILVSVGIQTTQAQVFQATPITPAMVQAAQNGGVELPQPFQLTNGERCARIRCVSQGCEDCALIWKDLNGDAQVQPNQELRCRCTTDENQECQIQRQEVECPQ